MGSRAFSRYVGLIAAGIVGGPGSVAFAQSAPPGTTSQLEEIVVNAQKRAENVQSVPISIEAFSQQTLASLQVTDTSSLMSVVPGLNITRANVAAVPFIRGVGNFTATPGVEAAVATYVDDVYHPSPSGSTFSFNNVDHIEVDKGPQGTLFGRNAAGGVIAITTRNPTQDTTLDYHVGYANYNTVTTDFYAAGGITSNLVADLAVQYENQADGWGKNLYNNSQDYLSREWSMRSKWIYTPTDTTKIRFIADYDRTRTDQGNVQNIYPGTFSSAGYGHFGGFYDSNTNFNTYGEGIQYGLSLRADQDLGWGQLASITAWRRNSGEAVNANDAIPITVQKSHNTPKDNDWTQELQLSSPTDSTVKWVAGFFYFFDQAERDPIVQYQTSLAIYPGSQTILDARQDTTSYAGYAQATTPLFDPNTRLTFGYRYTVDQRSITGTTYETTGQIIAVANQQNQWPKGTYRLALDHNFADNSLGYVSLSRGFNSGGYSVTNPGNPPVAPQVLDALEVGTKTDLFDGTLRINAAAFYDQFHNLQVQELLTTGNILLNAGQSELKGVDLDVTALPAKGLTLRGSVELLDPRYTSFPAAVYNYPCVTTTINKSCKTYIGGGGYYTAAANAAGNYIAFSPWFTANMSATYKIPTAQGDFALVASLYYNDGFYFDVQNTLRQPSYFLLNSSVTWTSPSGMFDARLWGENLTNSEYYSQRQLSGNGSTYSAAPPLTFGVTLGFHWG